MKRLLHKIRSKKGETIAEALVAIVVAALGITALAGGISTAASMITESDESIQYYYSGNNALSFQSNTGDSAGTVDIVFYGSGPGVPADISGSDSVTVKYYKNRDVISYRK